jgi:RES domain-containing protein
VSISRSLERRLASLERRISTLRLWRGVREAYEPLSSRGARIKAGRWNPPGVEALYASFDTTTVRAEVARGAERRGLPEEAFYPLVLVRLQVDAELVDLSEDEQLGALGVTTPFSVLSPIEQTRRIGAAAVRQSVGWLIVPSVVTRGNNVVFFPANLAKPPRVMSRRRVSSPGRWP